MSREIANKHKGSSIAFNYSSTPPRPKQQSGVSGLPRRESQLPLPGGGRRLRRSVSGSDLPGLSSGLPGASRGSQLPVKSGLPSSKNATSASAAITDDKKTLQNLEHALSSKEKEVSNLRLELAAAVSRLEQEQNKHVSTSVPSANVDAKELAAARDEAQRLKAEASALTEALETCRSELTELKTRENQGKEELRNLRTEIDSSKQQMQTSAERQEKLAAETEKEKSRATELETRLAQLQKDSDCKVHNAESARAGLEAKFKEREKELKNEIATTQTQFQDVCKKIEQIEKQKGEECVKLQKEATSAKQELERLEEKHRSQRKTWKRGGQGIKDFPFASNSRDLRKSRTCTMRSAGLAAAAPAVLNHTRETSESHYTVYSRGPQIASWKDRYFKSSARKGKKGKGKGKN